MSNKMKAAQIYGKKDIRIVELPIPEIKENEVLVKVKACGICGTDIELFEGNMPYITQGYTTLPLIPGHEWSGVVEKTGSKVNNFKRGDRITGDVSLGCGRCDYCLNGSYNLCENRQEVGSYRNKDGAFAEYIVMPERHIFMIPDNISFEEAAMIEPAAFCVYGIMRTGIKLGSRILVIGDGPIGQLAAQCAKKSGAAEVFLSGSYESKLDVAKSLGVSKIVNRHKNNVIEWVKEQTNGEGADIVVEACGKESGLQQAVSCVRPGGKICLLSIYPQENVQVNINKLVANDINVYGILASPNTFKPTINMLKKRELIADRLITHTRTIDEIEEALKLIYSAREEAIKVMILF